MRSRGKGFKREEFYSICSQHHPDHPSESCDLCNKGEWINIWLQRWDSALYKYACPVWLWWHNRGKRLASHTKTFKEWFPDTDKKSP